MNVDRRECYPIRRLRTHHQLSTPEVRPTHIYDTVTLMPYDVFGAMKAKSYTPEGGISNAPSSPHMALSHESMPIITVGAYRMHACRSQSRSTEVRERARQPIAPLARALRRLRRQPGTSPPMLTTSAFA